METPYKSPYNKDGGHQPALHTKHYVAMHQDIHYEKGMMCLDCHTSIDVHSDGFIAAANLGAVEIECSDCHGTPNAYPWELPLGFSDEYAAELAGRSRLPSGTSASICGLSGDSDPARQAGPTSVLRAADFAPNTIAPDPLFF
jgi:hypothetical protein